MKRYHLIILAIVSSFFTGLSSCKKLIEIPSHPPTQLAEAQEFGDSATAMTAVAGVYTYSYGGFAYSDAYLAMYTGLSSDELTPTATDEVTQQFYHYGLNPFNYVVSSFWSAPYRSIYPVNAIISSINNNSNLSPSFIKEITAEMKVVRALYYFNTINLFGAVPLVTTTDYQQTAHIARTPVDSVYMQIARDLTDAVQNLPADYPSAGRVRPNLYTALTLLAKVHLYQNDWKDAYNEADSVINSGLYGLETNLDNVFLDGSNEAIWQLPAQVQGNATQEGSRFVPSFGETVPNFLISSFLLNAFEPGDLRKQKWIGSAVVVGDSTTSNYYYPYKYKNVQATQTPVEDYMIFRLGEVYLIRAEAAAHLGNLNQALSDLDMIRNRAGLSNSTASGQTEILQAIIHERQVELFTEWGNRWFDLKRTGTAGAVLGTEKTGWQENAALYPIPQDQLKLDNLLKQNPGY